MPVSRSPVSSLLGALGWFLADSLLGTRRRGDGCAPGLRTEGLQLDDTVSVAGIGPERDDAGALRLRRFYNFEYSDTGDNRRRGSVVMLGQRVIC